MSDIHQGFQNVDAFWADAVADWWRRLAAAAEAGHFLVGFPGFWLVGVALGYAIFSIVGFKHDQ